MLLQKWGEEKGNKKPTIQTTTFRMGKEPEDSTFVLLSRGDVVFKMLKKPDPKKMKKALAWLKRNAAKNVMRNFSESGAEHIRKIRDRKIKA